MSKVVLFARQSIAIFLSMPTLSFAAINGTVFQDFNGNGVKDTTVTMANVGATGGSIETAIDKALAGVTVTATCLPATGTAPVTGTATTDVSGNYSIALSGAVGSPTAGAKACRVEFAWPAAATDPLFGFKVSSVGSGANETTQFVNDGGTANLGLNHPADYCQNNPLLATNCYAYADNLNGAFKASPTLYTFPYTAGAATTSAAASFYAPGTSTATGATGVAQAQQIGSTWGLAYNRVAKRLYAGAYFKRHSGFGPGTGTAAAPSANRTGAIYSIDPATSAVTVLAELSAGPDLHDATNYDTDNGNTAWDAVGKTGLGGLAVSEDGTRAYVMNLFDRKLYVINTATGATVTAVDAPIPAAVPAGARAGDMRPFAVQWWRGQIYVGTVDTRESVTPVTTPAGMNAYIYKFDPATNTFAATEFFSMSLDFTRADAALGGSPATTWRPWKTVFEDRYHQPMLTGIAFDRDGSFAIGMRDRHADQLGDFALSNPSANTTRYEGYPGGDLYRVFKNTSGALVLEGNARGPDSQGTGGQTNNKGPGGGEFYFEDNLGGTHGEITLGGVLQLPGRPQVLTTSFDAGASIRTGGVQWMNNTSGAENKAFDLYQQLTSANTPQERFGKSSGVGDLEALCDAAPIQIGNRVWRDTNNNGVQDPGEPPIANVVVNLYSGTGTTATLIATALTNADGEYYFSNDSRGYPAAGNSAPTAIAGAVDGGYDTTNVQGGTASTADSKYGILGLAPNAPYEIRLDAPANYLAGTGPLLNLLASPTNTGAGAPGSAADARDSDATVTTPAALVSTTNVPVISYTTGGAGANDHTLDFGFSPTYSIGNRVWFDTNNDGILNNSELPIGGVKVQLLDSVGVAIAGQTVVTDANGFYRFDGLAAGTYSVRITPDNWTGIVGNPPVGLTSAAASTAAGTTPLAGYTSSGTTATTATTANNSNDHGVNPATAALYTTAGVTSSAVTLGAGSNPAGDVDAGATGAGANSPAGDANDNLAVDFGFFRLSVGNVVFADNGAGAGGVANDGIRNGAEPGLVNAVLQLVDSGGNVVAGTTTDSAGNYSFTQQNASNGAAGTLGAPILPGGYTIRVVSGVPAGSLSSGTDAPNTGANNTDTGQGTNATPTSFLVNLNAVGASTGPTAATGAAGTTNGTTDQPRMDFGFVDPIDLQVTKTTTSGGPYTPGVSQVTYQLVARNNGPAAAKAEIVVKDKLPVGLTAVSATGTNWTCTPTTGAAVEIVCTRATAAGALAASADANPIIVTVSVDAGATGSLVNTAQVNPAAGEPRPESIPLGTTNSGYENGSNVPATGNPSNNDDSQTTAIGAARFSIGDVIWIDANNNGKFDTGESPLSGVQVQLFASDATGNPIGAALGSVTTDATGRYRFDNLLAGDYVVVATPTAGYVSSTGTPGIGATNAATTADELDNGKDTKIAAGNPGAGGYPSGKITLSGATAATAEKNNGATVPTSGINGTGGDALDNRSDRTVDFGFYLPSDWTIAKAVTSSGPYTAGSGTVTYTLTATNLGPGVAKGGIVVKDKLPVGLTATSAAGTGWSCTPTTGAAVEIVCTRTGADLAATASAGVITVNATVDATATGALVNKAQVNPDPTQTTLELIPLGTTDGGYENGNPTPSAGNPSNNDDSKSISTNAATFSLGNRIWLDSDNDGTVNGAEVGSAGVIVQVITGAGSDGVFGTADDVVGASQLTDANGYYRFDGLLAGTYAVRVAPENWSGFTAAQATALGVTAGTAPLAGYANSGPTETPANSTGTGSTANLDKGVNPATAAGYTSLGVTSNPVTLGTGNQPSGDSADVGAGNAANGPNGNTGDNLTVDMGFYRLTVGNEVFVDNNNNGLKDGADAGQSGVAVELLNGGVVVATAITDASGNYSFTQGTSPAGVANGQPLLPGTDYTIRLPGTGIPAGYTSSADPASGANPTATGNGVNSDDNGKGTSATGIVTDPFTLSAGALAALPPGATTTPATATTSNNTLDFGLTPLAVATTTISGTVYVETGGNTTLNPGVDTPLGGVTITLTYTPPGSSTPVTITTTTSTTPGPTLGTYSFPNIPIGSTNVTITETQPAGLNNAYNTPGTGGTLQGNNTTTLTIPTVTATGSTGNNFAEVTPPPNVSSVSGTVYVETGGNTTLNPGVDTPLGGVTVTLTYTPPGSTTPVSVSVITDSTPGPTLGTYNFPNIPVGSTNATITETQPPAYNNAYNTPGTGGTLQGNNTTTLTIPTIGATGSTGNNFAEVTPPNVTSVSGTVYVETGGNTTLNPGVDTPLGGVTVTLTYTPPGSTVPVSLTTTTDATPGPTLGTYNFPNIPVGSTNATITETQPPAYNNAYNTPGTGGTLQGNNTTTLTIPTIGATGSTGNNFAEVTPPTGIDLSTTTTGVNNNNGTGTFTVTTSNVGTQPAPNTVTTTQLPPGLVGVVVSNSGTYNPTTGLVTWPSVPTFAPGTSVSYTITVPLTGTTTIPAQTTVTAFTTPGGTTAVPEATLVNNPSSAVLATTPPREIPTLSEWLLLLLALLIFSAAGVTLRSSGAVRNLR